MRRRARQYLRTLATVALGLMLATAALNLLIDPYGVFALIPSTRLERSRLAGTSVRITKAEALRRGQWDTVILGSSRVEVGMDPRHPAWGTPRVYNAGLPGVHFIEMAGVFDYLNCQVHPRRIILCIDYFQFNDRRPPSDQFAQSRFNPHLALADYHADALLGFTPTKRSLQTLIRLAQGVQPEYDELGLRIKPMNPTGQSAYAAFEGYLARSSRIYREQGVLSENRECFEHLNRILLACRASHCELIVVIMPVHAIELELLRSLGAGDAIEQWKRKLVATLSTAPEFPLWDFTGYRSANAEPIPRPHETTAMTWYWEPGHCKKELGDALIYRITGVQPPATLSLPDFGAKLDPSNIDSHLATLRHDRALFAATHADELLLINHYAQGDPTRRH